MTFTLRYVADVADFELKWHTHRHEVRVRRERRRIAREWAALRSRLLAARGTGIDDAGAKAQYVLDSNILVEVARVFADDGDHHGFAQVAFFLADLLHMETSDERIAALAWTMRAKLLHAARRLGGATLPALANDLRWSLAQYTTVTRELSGEWLTYILRGTVHHWLDIVTDGQDAAIAAPLAEFLVEESRRAGEDMRVSIAVAQSLAGLHEEAAATFEAVTAEVIRDHPNARWEIDEWVENAWAVSRFRAACRNDEACRREYGPFARWIHSDCARLRPGWFEHEEPHGVDPQTEMSVGPMAFTDPEVNLVVLWEGLEDRDRTAVLMHELAHLKRRAGQVLRTEDGRRLLARRDVPVAAAETYARALWGGAEPGGKTAVPPSVMHLVGRGADWARRHPEASGRQIQNMLDHYTALHTQEPPSSYPCAAILVGMAATLLAGSGPRGVASYLSHLAVMDHAEALEYGRRHPPLAP